MDKSEKFWNRKAEKYSKSKISDMETYEKKLKITQGYMRPDMEILEMGCGTGTTALIHAPFVKHVRATDFSRNMVDIARAKAEKQGIDNVTFERATVEEPGQPDASVDMVLALNLLHLVKDWPDAIRDAHRMLKPGGIYVTSTACLSDSMAFMKPIMPLGRAIGIFPTVSFFTQKAYHDAMTDAGFEIEHEWHPGGLTAIFMVAKKPD